MERSAIHSTQQNERLKKSQEKEKTENGIKRKKKDFGKLSKEKKEETEGPRAAPG